MNPDQSDRPGRWFAVRHSAPAVRIDFAVVARHRALIEASHEKTLEQLQAKGGLNWIELWCGFTGRALYPYPFISERAARDYVLAEVGLGRVNTPGWPPDRIRRLC